MKNLVRFKPHFEIPFMQTHLKYFTTLSKLSARKYIRSVSQTALHYKPESLRQLSQDQNLRDRVVQNFFDTSNISIGISEAAKRLLDVSQFSTPSHSFYQIRLPFSRNQHLRRRMVQFMSNNIRTGRILELMDYIAANVAYRYCTSHTINNTMDELNFFTVTACIDEIDFYYPISSEIDCDISGFVSFAGKSSMEIQIDAMQFMEGVNRLACSAKFVMVARDKETNKAYAIPSLNISGQKDSFKFINELGEERQKIRKEESKKTLLISPPTYQESSEVHRLLLEVEQGKASGTWIPMNHTAQRSSLLMHLEDKNLSGKIFGGYVLRLAYQLGWLSVLKFLKGNFPVITHIDDVQFLAPVEIGSSLQFKAQIGFVDNNFIHALVKCKNIMPDGKQKMTNIVRITFEHSLNPLEVPKVYPESVANMNDFIESMRRLRKISK